MMMDETQSLADYLIELDQLVERHPTDDQWKDLLKFERHLILVALEIPVKDPAAQKQLIDDSRKELEGFDNQEADFVGPRSKIDMFTF